MTDTNTDRTYPGAPGAPDSQRAKEVNASRPAEAKTSTGLNPHSQRAKAIGAARGVLPRLSSKGGRG
jgi:hypothetical protein